MASRTPSSILVIDDDRPFARSVQILLEDEGRHHVAVAPSVDHAMDALAASTKIDLVIIDLAILDEHVVKLSQVIQNQPGGVAVIVMTAHEAALEAAHSRHFDVTGFLAKPIDPSTLLALVSEARHDRRFQTGLQPRSTPDRNHFCNREAPSRSTD